MKTTLFTWKFYPFHLKPEASRLFGGNLMYVFHQASETVLKAEEIVSELPSGFYAFIDLIYAKRAKRVRLLGHFSELVHRLPKLRGFKRTMTLHGKAKLWLISDLSLHDIAKVTDLTDEQKRYPLACRYTDFHLPKLVGQKWSPELDERIR